MGRIEKETVALVWRVSFVFNIFVGGGLPVAVAELESSSTSGGRNGIVARFVVERERRCFPRATDARLNEEIIMAGSESFGSSGMANDDDDSDGSFLLDAARGGGVGLVLRFDMLMIVVVLRVILIPGLINASKQRLRIGGAMSMLML
jgi:hypothetical protein